MFKSLGRLLWTVFYVITTIDATDRTRNRDFGGDTSTRDRITEWITSDCSSDDNSIDERPHENTNVYRILVEHVDYINQESTWPNANDGLPSICPSTNLYNQLSALASAHDRILTRYMNVCSEYTVRTDGESSRMNLARFHASPHSIFVKRASDEDYIIYIPRNPPTSPQTSESNEYFSCYDSTLSSPSFTSSTTNSTGTWPHRARARFPWIRRTWP